MGERAVVRSLREIERLRETQTGAAASEVRRARLEHDRAAQIREESEEHRDHANTAWYRLLGEVLPNPGLVRMAGAWLLEKQQTLDAEELNLRIVQSRLDLEQQNHRAAIAREIAAKKIGEKFQKRLENMRAERHLSQQSDSILWARRK